MTLAAGTRLGPYEIRASIGAGGMGEVFRALDTTLSREVAIKVLPSTMTADPERLARFKREAQLLASLSHSNIAHVYGFEAGTLPDGRVAHFLAMELVEGEDLAERLKRGAIPLDEAIAMARQIAEGLEEAHEHGIVHRDLKPANIKVAPDGRIKILDFGLAKALEPGAQSSGSGSHLSHSPTMSRHMTEEGMILGTAAYMSPEQARGKAVDRRADIWSFGVVLFEMLTGGRLFAGETVSDILASVLKTDPDWTSLPPSTPPPLRRVLQRCLTRDPKNRLREIGEARITLTEPMVSTDPSETHAARRPPMGALAGVALIGSVLTAALAWTLKPVPEVPLRRFELPDSVTRAYEYPGGALAPDGSALAYIDQGRLWVRRFDTLEPRDLGALPPNPTYLEWSPDARSLAFAAEHAIQTIPAVGGPIFVVCQIPATGRVLGIAWSTSEDIIFSVWRESLYSVKATGGDPQLVLAIDPATEIDFHSPSMTPGGGVIVARHSTQDSSFHIQLLRGGKRTTLYSGTDVEAIRYAPPGFAVFRRSRPNAGIWTAPWTEKPIDLGSASLLAPDGNKFEVGADGTLLYFIQSVHQWGWAWVDRNGQLVSLPGKPQPVQTRASLSPDGSRIAFVAGRDRYDEESELIVRDLETGIDTPLTLGQKAPPKNRLDRLGHVYSDPAWFPSGKRLLYAMGGGVGLTKLVSQQADTIETPRDMGPGLLGQVSSDGRLVLTLIDERGHGQIRQATLAADGSVGESRPVFTGADEPNVGWFDLSRDGQTLAYSIRETDGRSPVYLTEFPSTERRVAVDENGRGPRFTPDGRELLYVKQVQNGGSTTESIVSVRLSGNGQGTVGAPTTIYTRKPGEPYLREINIAPDGRRVLVRVPVAALPGEGKKLVYVQNWRSLLKK